MAVPIKPKSEMRKNDNISYGLGEVPAVEIEGVLGWGLPGGQVTFSEQRALEYAKQLDVEIRIRAKDLKQLLFK